MEVSGTVLKVSAATNPIKIGSKFNMICAWNGNEADHLTVYKKKTNKSTEIVYEQPGHGLVDLFAHRFAVKRPHCDAENCWLELTLLEAKEDDEAEYSCVKVFSDREDEEDSCFVKIDNQTNAEPMMAGRNAGAKNGSGTKSLICALIVMCCYLSRRW